MKKLTLILLLSLFSVSNSFSQNPGVGEAVSPLFYELLLLYDIDSDGIISYEQAREMPSLSFVDYGLSGEPIKVGDTDKTYFPNLGGLSVQYNNITTLNISLSAMSQLICNNNQITSLTVNDNLIILHCDTNNLSVLDLTECTKLYSVYCTGNPNLTQICLSAFSYQEMLDHPNSFKKDETAEWLNCETTTGVSSSAANNLRLEYTLGDAYLKVLNAEKIDIYNADGQKKASVSADKLNVTSLPSGIYIVSARNAANATLCEKFVK